MGKYSHKSKLCSHKRKKYIHGEDAFGCRDVSVAMTPWTASDGETPAAARCSLLLQPSSQFSLLCKNLRFPHEKEKKKILKPPVVCAPRGFDTRKQKDSSCVMLCQSLMTQSPSSPSREVLALRAGGVEFPSSRRKPWAGS